MKKIKSASKKSAGLLLYRYKNDSIRFLLVHPGGPFWAKKDTGAWSVPKGEIDENEDPLAAAKRETFEETGINPVGEFIALTPVKQKSGKVVFAWAVEYDYDILSFASNTYEMEWPPNSGRMQLFPEVDKAEWFDAAEAKTKINPAQVALIEQAENILVKKKRE
jgi:predicted NUDIX family NTP pyrophosphohydrolase